MISRRRRWPRTSFPERVARRPLLAVSGAALLAGAANARWTARHRPPGSFDTDECGYLATALRLARSIRSVPPRELARLALESTTAPLVPAVSAPVAVAGRRSVSAMAVVPAALHGASAVAVTGIARRLAGDRAALVAGAATLGLPGGINAARHHGFSAAGAAAVSLTTWALLATGERHRRRHAVLFGASVGAMSITRTMTVGFLPALAAAAAARAREVRLDGPDLALATAAAALVAGPWWSVQRRAAGRYLLRYGYGDLAGHYGGARLRDRAADRSRAVLVDVRPALLAPAAVALAAGFGRGVAPGGSDRDLAAVTALVGAGALALLTTSNAGSGFELPLELPAIALICALGARAPRAVRRVLAAWTLTSAGLNSLLVGRWSAGRGQVVRLGPGHVHASDVLWGGLEYLLRERIATDPRLDPSSGRRAVAELEWWNAADAVAAALCEHEAGTGPMLLTGTGSGPLLSMNHVLLATELRLAPLDATEVVDTTLDHGSRPEVLAPVARGRRRVLVVILGSHPPYPSDRGAFALWQLALQHGWRTWREVPLPDGGTVQLLAHPSNGTE